MESKEIILRCRPLFFYTKEEESTFYKCIKRVSSIIKIEKTEDGINLHLKTYKDYCLFDDDFDKIKWIFYRYNLKNIDQFNNIKLKKLIDFIGKEIFYYHDNDFDILLKWIQKIKAIQNYYFSDLIILSLSKTKLSENDLLNITAIYERYNLQKANIKGSNRKTESKNIFKKILLLKTKTYNLLPGTDNPKKSSLKVKIDLPAFYTKEDEESFFYWINLIKTVTEKRHIKNILYLYFSSLKKNNLNKIIIPYDDYLILKILFNRYKIKGYYEELSKFSSM
jgi:hypothetical protein